MTWGELIPVLTVLTSLIPAALIFLLPEHRIRARTVVNISGATLKLGLILVMLWEVLSDVQAEFRYEFRFHVLPDLAFILRADALAIFFVTLSGLLWFLTTVYAIAYLEGSPHRSRFFGFFSLCVSATVGIALAGNLFTFVVFYELLTLSTYPLVVHRETEVARRAGRVYLVYTLLGGALLLGAAVWLHVLVPAVDFNGGASLAGLTAESHFSLQLIFLLLMVGLGVKAALVPLHGWLPQAMVAPAPVSALLHAVAVVKAGAFGIVRVVYDVYGIDRAHDLGVMLPLAIWSSVTIIYGSIRALFQDDLKRRLAFSTVSQVSYIALGVALLGSPSTVGGVVHLVHQGLMKITLFFCAGNLAETLGIKKVSEMHGVGRRMPWTMTAFTAGALGMIGVPPVCGFVSKWHLGAGAIDAAQYWVLPVLVASTLLNAAYFLPILYVAWFCQPRGEWTKQPAPHRAETAWGLLLPPIATAFLAIGTGLFAGTPFSPLQWAMLVVERAYDRVVIDHGLQSGFLPLAMENLLLLALAVPLGCVCFVLLSKHQSLALWMASIAALPAVVIAVFVEPGTTTDMQWVLLHMHLGVDQIGKVFLLLTSILWLWSGIYARGYLADDPRARNFFCFFLLAMTGNIGLVLSQDMVSFYCFFTLMSFASYPLVIFSGEEASLRAGRVYMKLVVLGEVLLLSGILLTLNARVNQLFESETDWWLMNPAATVASSLILIGFGIKAGLVPLHLWLPLAHPAAPTPASAVLSGAMIKAGLLGWMRFLPLGEQSLPAWGDLLLVLGLTTAFYGVAIGVTQRNAKAVLAYSSISQMGLISLGIGGGLLIPDAWPVISTAVLVYALHHALSKGCLFLSIGVAPRAAGTAWSQRLMQLGIVLPALALAGAPLTLGAISKVSLKASLTGLPVHWYLTLNWLFPLTSVGTTLLMARFLYFVWPPVRTHSQTIGKITLIAWSALLVTLLGAVCLLPAEILTGSGAKTLGETILWANLWPILLGIVLAWMTWRLGRRQAWQLPAIPPGDWLCLWEQVERPWAHHMESWTHTADHSDLPERFEAANSWKLRQIGRRIQAGEAGLTSWPGVAVSLLVVLGAFCCSWLWSR